MATYYWVGGTGTWDNSSTTNWRTASGGTTQPANAPTQADTVIFDTLSGSGTVTVANGQCLDWTCSNTSTITFNIQTFADVHVAGSITWSSGVAISNTGASIYCEASTGARTLNFAGKSGDIYLQIVPTNTAASYTLASAVNFGGIRVASNFNTSASNFAMTANSTGGLCDGYIYFDTGYVSLTGIAAVTLNASAISGQNGITFNAGGTYALNIAFGTSVLTTVTSASNINFSGGSYTGANTYSINATSAAGHALRPNGDIGIDDGNSVKVTLALQQAGNTAGNTLQNLYIYNQLAASTVTFAGTTNVATQLRVVFNGVNTFTGAVVVGNNVSIEGGTASFGSTVNITNNLYSYGNITVTGALTVPRVELYSGTASFAAVTCSDSFYGNNNNTLNISGAVAITNYAELTNTGGTISGTFTVTNNDLKIGGTISFTNTVTTSSATAGDINVNAGVVSFSGAVNCGHDFNYGSSGNLTVSGALTVGNAISLTGSGAVSNTNTTSAYSYTRSGGNLTLGAVTYSIRSSWAMQAGYTLTRSTSTVSLTGIGNDSVPIDTSFDSGGYTYQNVAMNGNTQTIKDTTGGSTALACAGTFTGTTLTNTLGVLNLTIGLTVTGALSLTGNSLVNRYFVRSSVLNSPRTITRGSSTLTNVDFSDITFAGATATGTSLGDCIGNSNITFTAAVVRYARATGNWSDTTTWSATSGGATGASAPLAQDNVILNAASGAITVTTNNRRFLGNTVTATGFTGGISVTNSGFIYPANPQTFTVTIASPGVLTLTTAIANDTAVALSTTGALPTGLSTGVTYYVVNSSGLTCNLATTLGGTPINTSGTQSGTHSIGVSTTVNFTGSFIRGSITVPAGVTLSGNDVVVFNNRSAASIDIQTPSSGISYLVNTNNGAMSLVSDLVMNTTSDFLLVSTGVFDTTSKNITCTGIFVGYNPFTGAMPDAVSSSAIPSKLNLNDSTVTAPGGADFFSYVLNMTSSYGATTIEVNAAAATLNFTGNTTNFFPVSVSNGTLNLGTSTVNLSGRNTGTGAFIVTGPGVLNAQSATINTPTGIINNGAFNGGTSTVNFMPPTTVTSARISGNAITFYNLGVNGKIEFQNAVTAANNLTTNGKSTIFGTGSLAIQKVLAVVQANPLLFANIAISYTGAGQLNTNNFTYYATVTGSGTIVAPASTDITKNTGITFVGKKKIIAFSAFSGTATLPSDVTPGAAIIVWGGGGQGGKGSTAGGYTGGASGAQAIAINAPLTPSGTIYVNAASSTGKKTAVGSGTTGGSTWVNYVANTTPSSTTNGVLAIGGGGGGTVVATGGSASSCIGDYNTGGKNSGASQGSGGASFYYAGANGGNASNAYGGGGGGGYSSAPTAGGANGGNGGTAANGALATGGTGGLPPTNGDSGIFGGGGGGGGAEINNNFTTATSLTRIAGTTTATITSPSHGIPTGRSVYLTITLVAGSWTYSGGGTLTVNCSSPHGLTTGNATYLTFTRTGGPGTFTPTTGIYTVTVTSTTAFTVTASGSGTTPSSGTVVIGNGIPNNTQTSYTATVTGANTFTITTSASTNIYAVATVKYRPINSAGANGGDGGAWEGVYQPDLYNNGSPGSLPAAGIGPGGGGGGGGGVYSFNPPYVLTGTSGSGGDGGVGAGGGGNGIGSTISANFTYGDGGAGGPGLIIIQYQVPQGTSQAGFVG